MSSNEHPSRPSSHPSIDSTLRVEEGSRPRSPQAGHGNLVNEKQATNENVNDSQVVTKSALDQEKALEAGIMSDQSDIIIVSWDGLEDPMNPKNWSKKKKWAATAVVSAYTLVSPIASAMIAPAVGGLALDFHITDSVVISMTVSIFILAYAFGPLVLGPLSEIFGRVRVLQLANLFFLVFNIAGGFSKNTGQFLAFRFLAGFGGSAPLAIGGGVLGDCWSTEERGQAVAIYSLAPVLGPALGPVAGSWVAEKASWRWVFWSTSFFCGAVQVLGLLFLRETFAPVLLEKRAERIRQDMGLSQDARHLVRTEYDTPDRHWQQIFAKALVRPFKMFVCEPIIQLLGIYMAFVYGLIYLILVTIPDVFQKTYKQPVGLAGLHYIALGIGLTGASQINARSMDRIYRHFKEKNDGQGRPEFRLPSMFVGVVLIPIGLLLFGWSSQERVFWIVPDIGLVFLGGGMILIQQSVQTYVIDAFTLYAASALGSVSFLRSLAGFGFPLFAPAMYNALGYGTGNTVLAAFAIGVGCPAPFLFWYYGQRVRNRSRYANKKQ